VEGRRPACAGARFRRERIASRASDALKLATRWEEQASPQDLARRITVYPKGRTLPESFLSQDWSGDAGFLPCLRTAERCDAFLVNIHTDEIDEIFLMTDPGLIYVFAVSMEGRWQKIGTMTPAF
jgi:hypothetical protein